MNVIIQLKNERYIMGKLSITHENSVELEDALSINYSYDVEGPAIYFTKYCPFTKSSMVSFINEEIMHMFKDPTDDIVEYYEYNVERILRKKPRRRPGRKKKSTKFDENALAWAERAFLDDEELH